MAVNVPPTNAVGPREPTSRPVSIAQAPMVSRTARTVRGWGARSQAQVANHPPTSPADAPPIVESNPLHPRSLATLSRRGARPGPPAEDAYAPPVRRVLALLAAVAMVVASLVIRARLDRNQGVGGRVLRLTFPSLAVRRRFTYRARWTRKGQRAVQTPHARAASGPHSHRPVQSVARIRSCGRQRASVLPRVQQWSALRGSEGDRRLGRWLRCSAGWLSRSGGSQRDPRVRPQGRRSGLPVPGCRRAQRGETRRSVASCSMSG
jgi:hypothetical protein